MNKILLVFFLPIVTASPQDGQITCSITPVDSGQDIALTCLFPEDLNVTKKDFSVYHYTDDTKPDAVIDCWWMKGNLSCNVNDGYKYNKTVNTQLTVTLSHVSTTHMGTYVCQVAGYRSSSFGTCQLEAEQVNQEGKISCTVPLVQPDEDTSLTCHYPEDLNVTKKDFSVYYYTEGAKPEAVLDCLWIDDNLKCLVNPGYTYNMNVNTQLTLNISHVMSVNNGTYTCQVAGYRPSSFGTCQFETEKSCRAREWYYLPPVQLGGKASFSCHFPGDPCVTKNNFFVFHITEVAGKEGPSERIEPNSHQRKANTGNQRIFLVIGIALVPFSIAVGLFCCICGMLPTEKKLLGERFETKLRFRKWILAKYE
ncbi:uncharacterized protein LOC112574761 isoform X2 [Pomacea canaliculata]|uniref:uncharacterized protein LOC112574761 isoform X2 n=1 Tax=Pomacea canaliculata TaxID=400727 RepID=UPI000D7256E0|nr:uncharacterized protein LOC112574761 isoform X2 [Pomacea canaliculata]